MDIVYIIARFHPFKGGAEQNCWQLATRSAAAGHNVTVITTDISPDGQKLASEEKIAGITIIRNRAWNKQLNLGFYPGLLPTLLRAKADVIHVENGAGFLWRDFCLFLKYIVSRGTHFIITPHGPFLVTPETHRGPTGLVLKFLVLFRWLGKIYFHLIWKRIFKVAIAVNPRQFRWLKKDFGFADTQIRLLPNGIESHIISDTPPRAAQGVLKMSYVGRLAPYKGIHKVIAAMATTKALNIEFTIMGRGDYEHDLLSQIKELALEDRVSVVINPTDAERDKILSQSQVIILTSSWEATGIALIEGMAKGNLVITNRHNEAAEILVGSKEGEVAGHILAAQDESAEVVELAELLDRLAGDLDLTHSLQLKAWKRASMFTWDKIFTNYLKLLNELDI